MGFLSLTQAPLNLSKATISFWFRVPKESFDAVYSPKIYWDVEVLNGVLPLIVLGNQPYEPYPHGVPNILGHYWAHQSDFFAPLVQIPIGGTAYVMDSIPWSPTVIGLYKESDDSSRPPTLFVHLQTKDSAVAVNSNAGVVGYTPVIGNIFDFSTGTMLAGVELQPTEFQYDDSSAVACITQFFNGHSHTEVTLDEWHHLLISWDLQGSNTAEGEITDGYRGSSRAYMSNVSKLYLALDDKNKTEQDLPGGWPDGGKPNDIVCNGCMEMAGIYRNPAAPDYLGPPSISVAFNQGIVVDAINIPALNHYDRSKGPPGGEGPSDAGNSLDGAVQKIELAELQIFAGVTLDTSEEDNRRAFIVKDEKRNADGNATGITYKPANPSKAKELMDKEPDILLHGSGNWKKGNNTGALGFTTDQDGNKKKDPSGQFKPTGKIKAYKPDPSLHG